MPDSPMYLTATPGNVAVITVTFKNEAGTATNPGTVVFTVKTPTQRLAKQAGTPQTFGQGGSTITNPTTGTFRLEVHETEGGWWWADAKATGAVEADVQGAWYVDPGRFG